MGFRSSGFAHHENAGLLYYTISKLVRLHALQAWENPI